MTFLVGYILGMILGATIGVVLTLRKIRLPYRWICPEPDCGASCGGTQMATVDRIATLHRESAHGR